MQISKTYYVEYAHRLMNHPGQCKNIHGHSGRVKVVLSGPVMEENGMVIDFGDLRWMKDIVMAYDHCLILHHEDPFYDVLEKAASFGLVDMRMMKFDSHPTAENFAHTISKAIMTYISVFMRKQWSLGLRLKSVSFRETLGNEATAY